MKSCGIIQVGADDVRELPATPGGLCPKVPVLRRGVARHRAKKVVLEGCCRMPDDVRELPAAPTILEMNEALQ